ncbi:MAG TPA: DNA gyrase subunit A [Haloplasmataceae bacterium]
MANEWINAQDEKIKEVSISREMKTSFLDYAMSVIVSRALPDVRDGLKPVQRRILYSMFELGMHPDKPYKKSARIVGEVMGKYHPHGDSAIYDAMVRMAQDFNFRYLLIDGHGNYGSIDGDGAAAMRYTEARLSKLAMELLRDINKDTVDFRPNYDESEQEPKVLPARFPNLLVNGAMGIAVGMATNIPPHNLGEVIDGLLALAQNPDISITELMDYIPAPDFPTGALILGKSGIRRAYEFGRGTIVLRAKYEIESNGNKTAIVITEIPYQVNKTRLIERIAALVKEKKIDGITDLRDESNREGIRIVIEVRRDVSPEVLMNNLFKQTQLQITFSINFLALVHDVPKVLNLKEMLTYYLDHQKEVVVRRTKYDLEKAEARAHVLEGLRIALDHIDRIIHLVRNSEDEPAAVQALRDEFNLSETQAKAIVDMRIRRLTGLERDKIENEYQTLLAQIEEYKAILASDERVLAIVCTELEEIKQKYTDGRRTEVVLTEEYDIDDEDLIPEQDIIITVTKKGYIKRLPIDTYKTQNRGGVGVRGMATYDDDFVEHMVYTSTHHTLLVFTNLGKVYKIKGYNIPQYHRNARGMPIVNLIDFEPNEQINGILAIREFNPNLYLFFATKQGIVKRTELSQYENIRSNGLKALNINSDDELLAVRLTDGNREIMLGTSDGKLVRFKEDDVRPMGRNATGVKGVTLDPNEKVVGMDVIPDENAYVLSISEYGYGKLTPVSEYRLVKRGGKGVKTLHVTEKNGPLVLVRTVMKEENDLMIVTNKGMVIRLPISQISILGRSAQGVRLIHLKEDQTVVSATIVPKESCEENGLESLDETLE